MESYLVHTYAVKKEKHISQSRGELWCVESTMGLPRSVSLMVTVSEAHNLQSSLPHGCKYCLLGLQLGYPITILDVPSMSSKEDAYICVCER